MAGIQPNLIRVLHFVFKVGDRTKTAHFYRNVLGMKFLRHEEFEEGCEAACNGPYDGKWSKSMVGYGPEDTHFVAELTYNYGIGTYKLGNDFRGITIHSNSIIENAKKHDWPILNQEGHTYLEAPGGYRFYIRETDAEDSSHDPVRMVSLASSNLQRSIEFWSSKCKMVVFEEEQHRAVLGYCPNQCRLELVDIGGPLDRATAFGRIAFSCPADMLPQIEKTMKDTGETILTPLIHLPTPGKATVSVVILADPDGHEICFVGDEAFRELSQVDPQADALLDKAVAEDKSNEWFAKKGKTKAAAE